MTYKNIIYIIVISFTLILSVLVPWPMFAPWLIVLASLMIGVIFISFVKEEDDRTFLTKLFIAALLLRIMAAFVLHIISLSSASHPPSWREHPGFFIDDGWGYSDNGWLDIVPRLQRGLSVDIDLLKPLSISGTLHMYDYMNGWVYLFTGFSPLTMFFLNCFIGALTAIFIYFISISLFGRQVSRIAAMLCAFWPSIFLWSTQNLKEPLTIFATVLCFWAIIGFLKKFNPLYLLVILLSLLFLMKFRTLIAKFIVIAIFLHLSFLAYRLIKRVPVLLLIIIPVCVLIFMQIDEKLIELVNPFEKKLMLNDIMEEIRLSRYYRLEAGGRLDFMPNYEISSVGSLLAYLPLGLAAVLFGPFPWQLFSVSQVMAVPETVVWYIMFFIFLRGLFFAAKTNLKYLFSMFVFIILTLLGMAVIEANIGTMFRHRAVIFVFFLIFMAVGINRDKRFKVLLKADEK